MRFFVFLVSILLGQIAQASTEVELLSALPKMYKGGVKDAVEKFDDPRFGAAVGYQFKEGDSNLQLTIILFDGGYGPVQDGLKSEVTKRVFEAAISDIHSFEKEGTYEDVVENEKKEVNLSDKYRAYLASLRYLVNVEDSLKPHAVESFLVVTGINGYMLKVRATGYKFKDLNEQYILAVSREIIDILTANKSSHSAN